MSTGLGREDIHALLDDLSEELAARAARAELFLVGGAALATLDLDADDIILLCRQLGSPQWTKASTSLSRPTQDGPSRRSRVPPHRNRELGAALASRSLPRPAHICECNHDPSCKR
jgi:hypothetical protein